jgi:predicted ATP-dependent protease
VKIIPVSKISEVLEISLVGKGKEGLLDTIKRFSKKVNIPIPDINVPSVPIPVYGTH